MNLLLEDGREVRSSNSILSVNKLAKTTSEKMSLYYDAAPLLLPNSDQAGSLKSRVFNSKDLKSTPKQVYALVSEASKWSSVLSEVIDQSQLLQLERKVRLSNSSPARKVLTDKGAMYHVAVSEYRPPTSP